MLNQPQSGIASRTQVIEPSNNVLRLHPTEEQQPQQQDDAPSSVLKKTKSKSKQKKPKVRWTQDVVDNEHMNKKRRKYVAYSIHNDRLMKKKRMNTIMVDTGVLVPVQILVVMKVMLVMVKVKEEPMVAKRARMALGMLMLMSTSQSMRINRNCLLIPVSED